MISAARAESSSARVRSVLLNGTGFRLRTKTAMPSTAPRAWRGTIMRECIPV